MEKKEDRRKRKTKAAIKEQFVKLALEKEISKITVVELATLADISRKTFYLNYLDIYDVLEDLERDIMNRFFDLLKDVKWNLIKSDPYPLLAILSDELSKSPLLIKFLISSTSSTLISKLKKAFINYLMQQSENDNVCIPDLLEYAIIFVSSGIIDVFREWYNAGQTITLKELSKKMSVVISHGITGII